MSNTSRPKFAVMWQLFRQVLGDGSVAYVGKFIGGKVGQNIASGAFPNACAIRLSYALNHAGIGLALAAGKHVSAADGSQYLFRVADMHAFLRSRFGPPDVSSSGPSTRAFEGKRGIILFEVRGWSDATGHVTLWDGMSIKDCSDHCYFANASHVHLWMLP